MSVHLSRPPSATIKRSCRLLATLLLLSPLCGIGAPAETPPAARANWMAQTRFGMFVHFGLYSIPGGVWEGQQAGRNAYAEWIRMQWGWPEQKGIPREKYDTLLARFNPEKFDAEEWIRLADEAGMKYFVITSKHHDDFALWDSKVSTYDIASTPFGKDGRDLLGELAAACRKRGIKLGFYYSHWQDWEHPGGALPPWPEIKPDPPLDQPTDAAFQQYWDGKCLPQITELIERYQPDMFWFDTWGKSSAVQITNARRDQLIALIRERAPQCMINGRISYHDPAGADFVSMGDNAFPDRANAPKLPWETPATMNHSWGYNRLDFSWRSFDELLTRVIRNASHGGSVTLNVGPMGDGRIQDAAVRRLRQFAAWMTLHRHTLHGTTRGVFEPGELPAGVHSTTGADRIYLHLAGPVEELSLPAARLPADTTLTAQVIETREFLPLTRAGETWVLQLPKHIAELDHPVLQIGAASAISQQYEDGQPVEPVQPGDFRR